MKALLVGGHSDGERVDVGLLQRSLAVPAPWRSRTPYDAMERGVAEVYTRRAFKADGVRVFAVQGLSDAAAKARLR